MIFPLREIGISLTYTHPSRPPVPLLLGKNKQKTPICIQIENIKM